MNRASFPISQIEIEEAHKRISPYIHKTPLLRSTSIDKIANCELFFKCENFQKVGAFKMRGACNALLQLKENELKNGVCTHSSGNHAQAVAKAAAILNVKAFIVMPENAPKVKIRAVEYYGGIIHFCKPTLQAREDAVSIIMDQTGATFIPPYDHKAIITGQASVAKEVFEISKDLDAILCPVGGGGLLAGTILSAHYFNNSTLVYGAEPSGADDAYQSVINHRLIPQKNSNTIADGLLTSLGELNFEIIDSRAAGILLADDDDIINAMQLIWERMKILVEPSAAVPLAALLKHKEQFRNKKIGIILSGGNIDLNQYFSLIR